MVCRAEHRFYHFDLAENTEFNPRTYVCHCRFGISRFYYQFGSHHQEQRPVFVELVTGTDWFVNSVVDGR